jgi:MoaA/NifB/PqqE/SkfB family radical SAM enzyme
MAKVELKPVDWLAQDLNKGYIVSSKADALHCLFTDRIKFKNFTIDYLDNIENQIRKYINSKNNNLLALDLVALLVQNKTSIPRLLEAKKILLNIDKQELDEILRLFYNELGTTINSFLDNNTEKHIRLVNWGIYNRCPLVCKGCYNIFNENILSLKECMTIVDKIAEAGADFILLSGGDPLLWNHIIDFCEYVRTKNLRIIIDTVGYNLDEPLIKKLSGLIYHIGLPLDGSKQEIITGFRLGKKDLFQVIGTTLKNLDKYGLKVRINTTVSKENINDLENIAYFINQHKNIKGWALYQWWPIRSSQKLISQMSITEENILQKITALNKIVNIPIYPRIVKERAGDTFFISSNGEVYAFNKSEHLSTLIIGDIKTQTVKEILKSPALKTDSHKWKKMN